MTCVKEKFANIIVKRSESDINQKKSHTLSLKEKIFTLCKEIPHTVVKTLSYERNSLLNALSVKLEEQPQIKDFFKKANSSLNCVHVTLKMIKAIENDFYITMFYEGDGIDNSLASSMLSLTYAKSGIWHPIHIDIMNHVLQTPNYFKIMIHGSPGTGKSSIIKILEMASICNDDDFVYVSSIYELPKKDDIRKDVVYIIEDIDLLVANKRDGNLDERSAVKFLLDFLDYADKIIITTNVPSTLDEAIYRSGRIDSSYEVGNLSPEEITTMVKQKLQGSDYNFPNINTDDNEYDFTVDEYNQIVNEIVQRCPTASDGYYRPCDTAKVIREYILESVRIITKQKLYPKEYFLYYPEDDEKPTKRSEFLKYLNKIDFKINDFKNIASTLSRSDKKKKMTK